VAGLNTENSSITERDWGLTIRISVMFGLYRDRSFSRNQDQPRIPLLNKARAVPISALNLL